MTNIPNIVDIEASGFGRGSYPIEVGIALADGSRHSFLIRPEEGWHHWDENAAKLHCISKEQLATKGLSAILVARKLNSLLQGQVIYSDAWGFDSCWIGKLFDHVNLMQTFRIDALSRLLSVSEMDQWYTEKERVIRSLGLLPHRALNDACILQETFMQIKQTMRFQPHVATA